MRKLQAQLCILKSSELRGFVNSGTGAQVLSIVLAPNSSPTSSPAHTSILLLRQLGTGLRPRLPDVLCSPPLWAHDRPSVELGFLISPFFSGPPLQDCAPVWALGRTRVPFLSGGCSADPTPSLPHSAAKFSSPARQNHNQANFLSASSLLSLGFRSPSAVSYNANSLSPILGIFLLSK